MLDGLREGEGKQVWPDFAIYEGSWMRDMANGKGRMIYPSGDIYEG